MDFSGAVVNVETMYKVSNMVIKQVYLGKGVIDLSSDGNFGSSLESNINISNVFDAAVAGGMKTTHRIMQLVTYFY